jgi:hypothetical protein
MIKIIGTAAAVASIAEFSICKTITIPTTKFCQFLTTGRSQFHNQSYAKNNSLAQNSQQ